MKTKHLLSICAAGMLLLQPSADAFVVTPKVRALLALTTVPIAGIAYLKFIYKKMNNESETLKSRAIEAFSDDIIKEEHIDKVDACRKQILLEVSKSQTAGAKTIGYNGNRCCVIYNNRPLASTPDQESLIRNRYPTQNTIVLNLNPNDRAEQAVDETFKRIVGWNVTMPEIVDSPERIRQDALKLAKKFAIPTFLTGAGLSGLLVYALMKS